MIQRRVLLTIKLRLKDKHARELQRQSQAVNLVWNYCNEGQQRAAQRNLKWFTDTDLQRLTAGAAQYLDLHAHTIQKVCQQYHRSHKQSAKAWLRFRGPKSLGWIPFSKGHARIIEPGKVKFRGAVYETLHWRKIPDGAIIHAGSFNQDARRRWYINMPIEFPVELFGRPATNVVGIDLGLDNLATLSTGERIEAPRYYRRYETKLGNAQRAKKKRLRRTISNKIACCRKDHLHKLSIRIAIAFDVICVGNISGAKLAQTRMAKSVFDAGWSTLRNQLAYKAIRHGARFMEVNEAYTTQVCSTCGTLPEGRPKGIAGLGIRQWTCERCGANHDRDVNAALNIARLGLETLAEGAQSCREQSQKHLM